MKQGKYCKKTLQLMVILAIFVTACNNPFHSSAVKMREATITIPTYGVGEAEENPLFYNPQNYQGAQMHVYPYKALYNLSTTKKDKEYKGLFLENEYISICVLPEIGGRLYFAKDKTTGYDFFYHNRVIKPALIGMAGAWMSGGIEWNIPHHHRVSTFMPVDYKLVENPDGSKTIWVGEYEKRHQTRWSVGLTVFPGKSYIKADIKVYNVTPYEQSFLIWANTAQHVNENYQAVFPPDVERAVFHAKVDFTDWPISHQKYMGIDFTKGVDISMWKNASQPTSFFQYDTEKDFVAGIDHGKQAGTLLIGDHTICKGKKMWNWGNNAEARLWDKKLTDSDGTYIELMMGAYSDNQPDYSWNAPFNDKPASMLYMPLSKMKSIKEANENMAVNLDFRNDSAIVEANVTEQGNYTIILTRFDSILYKAAIRVAPDKPFSTQIAVGKVENINNYKLTVLDKDENALISYQPQPRKNKPVPPTYKQPVNPSEMKSVQELYFAGLRLEQFYNPDLDPLAYYNEALKREPENINVNTQLGIYYVKHGMFDKASNYLQLVADKITGNYTVARYAEAMYYLGLCKFESGYETEAKKLFEHAMWDAQWSSASMLMLSRIEAQQGNIKRALTLAAKAYKANNMNTEAANLLAILLRSTENMNDAIKFTESLLAIDPLNHILQYEKYLQLKKSAPKLKDWQKLMRNEPDNYLETASRYAWAGMYNEAIEILNIAITEKDSVLANYPMLYYHLGLYLSNSGKEKEAAEALAKAASLPEKYCFPYGTESEKALKLALELNSNDAKAWYYLGNIVADNDPKRAIDCWDNAIKNDPNLAIAYRNRAFIAANKFDKVKEAINDMNKAIQLKPSDPLYYEELDIYSEYLGISPIARYNALVPALATIIKSYTSFGRFVLTAYLNGYADSSINGLTNRQYYTKEGAYENYHVFWVESNISKGIQVRDAGKPADAIKFFKAATTFPFNLENISDSKIILGFYETAKAFALAGNKDSAAFYYNHTANFISPEGWGDNNWPEVKWCMAMANIQTGNKAKANELFNTLLKEGQAKIKLQPLHEAAYTCSVHLRENQKFAVADGYYSMGLAYLGMGNNGQANQMFVKALEINPAHFGAANAIKF